jgi:hypothetical protein
MNKLTTFLGLTVLMAVQTEASLVNYSSESSFDAQGTIVYDSRTPDIESTRAI